MTASLWLVGAGLAAGLLGGLLAIALGAALSAALGARLQRAVPSPALRFAFGALFTVVALRLFHSAIEEL